MTYALDAGAFAPQDNDVGQAAALNPEAAERLARQAEARARRIAPKPTDVRVVVELQRWRRTPQDIVRLRFADGDAVVFKVDPAVDPWHVDPSPLELFIRDEENTGSSFRTADADEVVEALGLEPSDLLRRLTRLKSQMALPSMMASLAFPRRKPLEKLLFWAIKCLSPDTALVLDGVAGAADDLDAIELSHRGKALWKR